MAKFLTKLDVQCLTDNTWQLDSPLRYLSDIVGYVQVPTGFQTDLASVPRVPIAFMLFGNRAHYEGVLHDYLFRSDAIPRATFSEANDVFLEAMKVRGKNFFVRYAMWWGVKLGGLAAFHKRKAGDKLC